MFPTLLLTFRDLQSCLLALRFVYCEKELLVGAIQLSFCRNDAHPKLHRLPRHFQIVIARADFKDALLRLGCAGYKQGTTECNH